MAYTSDVAGGARVRCSFKHATVVICASNLVMVLYILHSLLLPLYLPSTELPLAYTRQEDGTFLPSLMGRTREQMNSVRDANRARLAAKPVKLIERVKEIQREAVAEVAAVSDSAKEGQQVAEEISKRFVGLNLNSKGLDEWRREKLKDARRREEASGKTEASSQASKDEAALREEVALVEAATPFDQEEGSGLLPNGAEIEDGIIPGRPVPEVCRAEAHTDYDGLAVWWGLAHHVESAADCCDACVRQARDAKRGEKRCNVWVYCPAEEGCFSPDIYEHKHQECWLKQADEPKVNFKGRYDDEYRREHPAAPLIVPWVSGFVEA